MQTETQRIIDLVRSAFDEGFDAPGFFGVHNTEQETWDDSQTRERLERHVALEVGSLKGLKA